MAAPRRRDLPRCDPAALLEQLVPPCPPWVRVPDPAELGGDEAIARWCREAAQQVAPQRRDRVLEALQLASDPALQALDGSAVQLVQLHDWVDSPANLVVELRRSSRRDLLGLTSLGHEGTGRNDFGGTLEVAWLPGPAAVLQETEVDVGEATAGWLHRVGLFAELRAPGLLGPLWTVSLELFGDERSSPGWADWLRTRLTQALAAAGR